ncbi:penicillin-binding transpeptidase domain-containing protein [Oscillospiraceae bacterium PP1C4]
MAKTPTYKMKSRMIIVLVAMIVFGFCVVLHQLFKLQIIDGEMYQSYALQQQLRTTRIGAKRGAIYDTNGKPLAQSATVWSVCIAPASIDTPEKQNAVVDCLAKILELDKDYVKKKLDRKQSLYEVVKTKVEKPQADELMTFVSENGIKGIFLEEDTRRYYPYGNFASTVLGFTNNDNVGAYGLESYYEKTLAGTAGRVVSLRNSKGVAMPMQYEQTYEAKDGNSLVLTIDETIQHYLEKNLETAVVEHKVGARVVGIVMDVQTGAILGMSTKPDFDPNDPYAINDKKTQEKLAELNTVEQKEEYKKAVQEAQFNQWRNKAISDPYEPGSVFKIITAAGALESGAINKNTGFYCPGWKEVAGRKISCWIWGSRHQGHGQQTFVEAVKNSCNPAFITIGQMMGASLFSDYFSNFGLTEGTGIDLPGEATSIYYPKDKMGISQLSSASFGQTFKVTPIQLITACSAAINGGKLMQPYLVKQVIDSEGNVVSNTEPVVKRQVISEEISKELSLVLEQVVGGGGSGKQAKIPGYRVGGKTGTSEKLDTDKTKPRKNILSFYGYAPVDDPKVACLVLLDEPDLYNAYGSTVAAPVVGSILADVLPYMGIEPQYTQEELDNIATETPLLLNRDIHDAESVVRIAGLKFRVIGKGTTVLRQVPGYMESIPKDGTIVLYTEENAEGSMVTVPDVKGMNGETANRTIVNAGLNISIAGTGIEGSQSVAKSQSPAAGEQVAPGTVVTVEFIDSQLGG